MFKLCLNIIYNYSTSLYRAWENYPNGFTSKLKCGMASSSTNNKSIIIVLIIKQQEQGITTKQVQQKKTNENHIISQNISQ